MKNVYWAIKEMRVWLAGVAEVLRKPLFRVSISQVAAELGLKKLSGQAGFEGRVEGVEIMIDEVYKRDTTRSWAVVTKNVRLPKGFSLRYETYPEREDDIQIGRGVFDQQFRMTAKKSSEVYAALSRDVRGRLDDVFGVFNYYSQAVHQKSIAIESWKQSLVNMYPFAEVDVSGLVCRMKIRPSDTIGIRKLIQLVKDMSKALEDIPGSLAKNVKEEPRGAVRFRMFLALTRDYFGDPLTLKMARERLMDEDPRVRLLSAVILYPAEKTMLKELFGLIQEASLLANALPLVLAKDLPLPSGTAPAILSAALDAASPLIQVVAAKEVGARRYRSNLDRLIALGKSSKDTALLLAVTEALGRMGEGEELVLRFLREGPDELQLKAAETLGVIGSVRAIEYLVPYTKGLLGLGQMARAADTAISKIQSRLGPRDRGTLSMSDSTPTEGALSPTPEKGALSDEGAESE